jgi:hypothetical protein
MAFKKYVGGASLQAQVDDVLFAGSWLATETVTFTVKDEGGGGNTVVITLSGSPSNEDVRDQMLAALQASGNVEFLKATWAASSTDVITGTATKAGRSLHLTVTTDSASGTVTNRTYDWGGAGGGLAVENSGPNALLTAANYETAAGGATTRPASGDELLIAEGSDPILYDLQYTTEMSLSLNALRKSPNHTGQVGDPDQGFSMNLSVDAGGDQVVSIDARNGGAFWWTGTAPNGVYVRGSIQSPVSVKIGGDVLKVECLGAQCRGIVKVADATVIDNTYQIGTRCTLDVGENCTSYDEHEQSGGTAILRTNPTTVKVDTSGFVEMTGDEDFTTVECRGGGRVLYTGEGNNTGTWFMTGGGIDLRPRTTMAAGTPTVRGGQFTDLKSANTVTYTAANGFAGDVLVTDQAVATE